MAFAFDPNLGLNRCNASVRPPPDSLGQQPKWAEIRRATVPKGTFVIPLRFAASRRPFPNIIPPAPTPAPKLPTPPPPAPKPKPKLFTPPPPPESSDLWTEKFRGQCVQDIFGHDTAKARLQQWIRLRLAADSKTPLVAFVHGPPGIGKTTLAHALLRDNGCEVFEVNASEQRKEEQIKEVLEKITLRKSVLRKCPVGLILDEIDGCTKSSVVALKAFVKQYGESSTPVAPIICIANELQDKDLREFARNKKTCLEVHVYPLSVNQLRVIAKNVLKQTNTSIPDANLLGSILQASNGDVRKLFHFLQRGVKSLDQLRLTVGDAFSNPFKGAQAILSRQTPDVVKYRLFDQDPQLYTLFLHHNYLATVTKPDTSLDTITGAFCDADVLQNQWDASYWSPEEYATVLVVQALRNTPAIHSTDTTTIEFPSAFFQARKKPPKKENTEDDSAPVIHALNQMYTVPRFAEIGDDDEPFRVNSNFLSRPMLRF